MSNLKTAVVAGVCLFSTICHPLKGEAQQIDSANRVPDVSKMGVEFSTKNFLRSSSDLSAPLLQRAYQPRALGQPPARKPDFRKGIIEQPVKRVISGGSFVNFLQPLRTEPSRTLTNETSSAIHGGKVSPGMVSWHPTLDQAIRASGKSKKPVMVFHLMGNLDDRFC